MPDESMYFTEDDTEPLPVEEWLDELTWSPSQCYYHLQHQGDDYILYLRWRWTNPWQAYVIKNAASLSQMNRAEVIWSGDVFELHHVYFDDVQLDLAKDKIISLFREFDGNFVQLRVLQQKV